MIGGDCRQWLLNNINYYLSVVSLGVLVGLSLQGTLVVVPFKCCDSIVALLKGITISCILIERERGIGSRIDI